MLYVNLRLSLEAAQPTVAEAAELLDAAAVQVAAGKLQGQLPGRSVGDRVWFSVQHATEDRPDPHSYVVKLKGRDCGAFVYVQDAFRFIESDQARHWMEVSEASVPRRQEKGQQVQVRDGKPHVALYEQSDYTIHDRTKSDHLVVGMGSHHEAILASVKRQARRAKPEDRACRSDRV